MNKKSLRQQIDSAFREGIHELNINKTEVFLLPYGKSLSREVDNSAVIIYEDLYIKHPGFFVHEILKNLDKLNKLDVSRTEVKELCKADFEAFCAGNHFKKGTNSKLMYGLYINDFLILVAGFSKPKTTYLNHKKVFKAELYRVVKENSIEVKGGLKKLIKTFVEKQQVTELEAFVSNEFEYTDDYLEAGFTVKEEYKPEYRWLFTETNERFSTGQLVKKGLLRREALEQMIHPPKGYLPIKDKGGKLLKLSN